MNKKIYLIIFFSFLLSGCLTEIRKLDVRQQMESSFPTKIKPEQQTVFFKLKNLIAEMPMGKILEVQSKGENCKPFFYYHHDKKGENDEKTLLNLSNVIKKEFEVFNIKSTDINVPIILDVTLIDYAANTCYLDPPATYGTAEQYVSLRWVFKADGKEMYSRTTSGYGNIVRNTNDANILALDKSIRMATRKLLIDKDFISILTFNNLEQASEKQRLTQEVNTKHNDKAYKSLNITHNKINTFDNQRSDWANGVFTLITEQGHGSGFAISKNLILTNNHVVAEEKNIIVKMAQDDGSFKAWDGEVIRSNKRRDIALIKIKGTLNKYFSIDDAINQGDDVFVMGSPIDISHEATLTKGIISHSKRTFDGLPYIQSDANIYGGNSGGPMINNKGNVIGVSVLGNKEAEGLNLFIPINSALDYLNITISN